MIILASGTSLPRVARHHLRGPPAAAGTPGQGRLAGPQHAGICVHGEMHWIDEVSEAMIAEFASVIPQARAMVLITYRPEYRGALTRTPNAHKLALAPLDNAEASALVTELVGAHPSLRPCWRSGSPSGPPVTPSSFKRSCAIWPNAVSSPASAGPTCAEPRWGT